MEKRKINKWKIYGIVITIIAVVEFGLNIGLSIGDDMLKDEYDEQRVYIKYLEDNLPESVYKNWKYKV